MATYEVFAKGRSVIFESSLSTEQAVEILRKEEGINTFRDSLLGSYDGRGLSERQNAWLIKLAEDSISEKKQQEKPGPYQALVEVFKAAGLSRLVIRYGSLAVSLAKSNSVNTGWLYVKWDDSYFGKISPEGHPKIFGEAPGFKEALDELASDPIGCALKHGHETGNCSCCGRALSDPISLYGGIGPVCLSRIAGIGARKALERSFRESDGSYFMKALEGLRKETGASPAAPAAAVAEVKENDFKDHNDYLIAKALSAL